ncbi:hypothetical protein [Christiangramia aquimixticola]|uniref:hypothetical protein n=1 Tax=Christiangramia aquimixticola TaxID=1697558 RepID=UPI003AA87191
MAEIEIEKKKSKWPWILVALLILAALLYFFVWAADDVDEVDDMENVTTEQVVENENITDESSDMENNAVDTTAVQEFDAYIKNPDMGLDHKYTNGALLKLIAAVKAVADNNGVNIDADLENARSEAQAIKKDPMKVTHANSIKDAGQHILKALKTIQNEKFPDLSGAYSDVDKAFAKIEGKQETLNQKEEVKTFFTKVSSLLNSMK